MDERRKNPRVKVYQLIKIQWTDEEFLPCSSLDISQDGLQVKSSEELEPGTKVYLLFTIGEGEAARQLSCEGIVVWAKPEGKEFFNGVKITNMDAEQELLIKDYIRNKL